MSGLPESPDAKLRILLIEDDVDHAALVERHLRAATVAAVTTRAETLAEARTQFKQHEFDVVLLDLNLPDGSIDESLSSVIAWSGGSPVVVLTALDDIQVGIRAINEGAQDYIVKQEMTSSILDRSLRYSIERARSQQCLHELTVQLQRANAALESFSSVVVHDLRSPVGRLKWYVELLVKDQGSTLSEDALKYVDVINRQADRMGGLITDLWTYAQRGGAPEPMTNVDCRQLVSDIYEMLDKPEAFRLDISERVGELQTQKTALEVVLRNLMDNAIKHHDRENGCLTIDCQDDGAMVEFVIRDDGPGVPQSVLERLSAPAQQRDKVDQSPFGLGLVVIREIVECRGGELLVSNVSPGAEFRVRWPSANNSR